jgi:DNA-binding CsgD family transcriptional regulator
MERLPEACSLEACRIGLAIDGMCVGMIVTNAAGRISWMNRSATRLLGLDKDESLGKLLGHELRDPAMAQFWHEAEDAEDATLGEVRVHWPTPRDLKVNYAPSHDLDGQRVARVLLFCDVSAERMTRIELSAEATERLLSLTGGLALADGDPPHAGLTAQELRILKLVGVGLGNEEIGREIHVAPSTVRTHLKHVYAKLGLTSRAEAIHYAIRHGLVRP